eukprot:365644-Chlamydomonas_euryale.AAC.10
MCRANGPNLPPPSCSAAAAECNNGQQVVPMDHRCVCCVVRAAVPRRRRPRDVLLLRAGPERGGAYVPRGRADTHAHTHGAYTSSHMCMHARACKTWNLVQ